MTIAKFNGLTLAPTPAASFAKTLNADPGSSVAGWSLRCVLPAASISTSGTRCRVTLKAGASYAANIDNCSIGIQDSTTNTTLTPTSFLFAGAASITIPANTTATSDWLLYTIDETLPHIVICDVSSTGDMRPRYLASVGDVMYYKAATDSYNQATVTGFSTATNQAWIVSALEVSSSVVVSKINGVSIGTIAKINGVAK